MLLEALGTARDLGRLHEIASVLARHGLGDAARRLGIAHALERAGRVVRWKAMQGLDREPQVRVREALEELGPTFVKVGQLLAGRSDLLPPGWTEELSKLHERAKPVPYGKVRAQLVEDLGQAPEELFRDFDPEPLAAASIAQVYRASLQDGTPVVLKVRRPGIREVVEADLRLLARLAERAEERVPELRRFRPQSLVRQFTRSLRNELDLRIESQNAKRLRSNAPDDARIVIPRMHTEWSRERLCVMDYLEGPSVGEWIRRPETITIQPKQIAELGAETVLRTVFVDGCFHADPHPGNLILLGNGRLGIIDFGMVGFLTEARRLEFLGLLLAVVERDAEDVVAVLMGWTDGSVEVDYDQLTQDCGAFIERYNSLPLRDLNATEYLGDLTTILRENDLFLPSDVAVLLKVFITLESVGRQLDPGFVMAAHVEPFAREATRKYNTPLAVARRGAKEIGSAMSHLRRDLRQATSMMRRGRIGMDMEVKHLDKFGERLDRSANRLTLGLVTAALIIGTAISLTVPGGPRLAGLPLFGFLGFSSSIAAGLWLLWSIMRSGRS